MNGGSPFLIISRGLGAVANLVFFLCTLCNDLIHLKFVLEKLEQRPPFVSYVGNNESSNVLS